MVVMVVIILTLYSDSVLSLHYETILFRGRSNHSSYERIVDKFTPTYRTNAYHNESCDFSSRQKRRVHGTVLETNHFI